MANAMERGTDAVQKLQSTATNMSMMKMNTVGLTLAKTGLKIELSQVVMPRSALPMKAPRPMMLAMKRMIFQLTDATASFHSNIGWLSTFMKFIRNRASRGGRHCCTLEKKASLAAGHAYCVRPGSSQKSTHSR